jgi:hypothetical protein
MSLVPSTTIAVPLPTTTTTVPVYVPPQVTSSSYPGNLEYPDNVSAAYPLQASGGVVSASATWSGAQKLEITITCKGTSASQSGASGLYVSANCAPGTVTITIAEGPDVQATVSYSLTVNHPSG